MDDIQSWSEVPSIAHFCSLFRAAFNLLDFDIEELEEALLTDGAEDSGSSLLQELIVRLLCGCIQNSEISTFNYQMFLRRLFRQKCHEYGRENPFNTDIDFQFLPLRTKVEILHALCDFRLDADDVQDLLKNLESDSLRVEPLGHDENKSAYWYFYGTRLYREDFPKIRKKIRDKRRKSKEDKKKKKKGKISYESDIEDDISPGVWQVVCYTEEDWEKLALKFKGSTCKDEKELHRTLTEDFLPEIPRLFAEKERLQRKRMMEYQPRRQSSRLEKLKQKEEEEKILAREEEEKLRLEKEERERRERLMARAVRAFHRGSSRSGSECGSYRSERDKDLDESIPLSEEKEKVKDKDKDKEKKLAAGVGRQTNNSLASATGQIIIQPPRRKKLRSKQVFKTSAEDLRTGMYKILDFIKNHDEAWPFVDPVDENYAPRYYSVIRKPMDLQRMEEKLDNGEYTTFNDFKNDFQLIVDNCRQYNGSENEYTEMVRNLQDAFQDAVDRYLESDPSSDEEVAVEFPPTFEEQKAREHGKKKRKLKRKDKDQSKDKENKKKKYESDDSDSKPPSLKPQRIRSPLSEKSGSIPGSDFDDREPDFLREHSPPQLVKATDFDLAEDSSSDSRSKINSKVKNEKPKKGTGVIKNVAAIEALSLATEQTLKDINKWLDDTPRFSEFSSASNSPSHFLSSEEFETVGNRIENDYKKSLNKTEKPYRTKEKDGATKKRKNVDANKHPKRKEVQRTIERLQPGKSKGNLITNLPKAKENVEESGVTIGLGLGKLVKESRNALLVKTDETAPKLSLGTVLKSDIIGFGKSKHNFDEKDGVKKVENVESESVEKPQDEAKPKINSLSFDYNVKDLPEKQDVKNEEYSKDKENDYAEKAKDEEVKTEIYEEKKRIAVKEITNKNKPTPNLSAWFKAFGAPKAPSTPRRKPELNDPPPTPGRAISPLQESRSELAFKDKDKAWYNDNRIEAPPSVESEEPKSVSVASPMPSPDVRPGSASSLNQNLPPAPRQRKASTSSSMSERSSFSQDPLDGSSPHLSMDERLGGYPGPYPSPLHRSPVAASPVLASPKGDDVNKPTYASINGTIRVGFYQDTSSNLQKSSPEKQSPNSNSPRDQSNASPFQSYPSHVYPPSVSQGNMSNVYGQATHSTTNPYSTYPTATSASSYENISQYSLPSMVNYPPEQYRTTKPQENYNYTRPVTYGNQETTTKPPSNIFPVKKRVYAEIESGRLQIPNETPKIQGNVQASSQSDSTNRNTYTESYSREMHLQQQAQQYDRYQQQQHQHQQQQHQQPPPQQQQQQQPPPRLNYQTPDNQEPKDANQPSQPLSFTMQQAKSQSDLSRIHAEISRLQLPADYSKLQQAPDPNDNLQRLQQQTMMPNPGNPNRGGYTNPMEAASLGRLMPPSNSTITEDNDGVFRNKYENPVQGSPPSVMTRLQGNVSTADSRTPCSVSYQNLSNLSHIVDRYQAEERLMQQSPFYSDKNLANIYSNYPQAKVANPPPDPQVGYNRDAELNIPKPSSFVDPKKSRKKQNKTAEVVPTSTNGSGSTAFQQYVGLKSTEPSAISLKTASVVPGSAFNFGPAPTGLGLSNSLYSEKDAYSGLFEDFRSQPSSYYSMVAAAAHHRSTPDPSSEKTSHASGSSNTFPFLGHPQARTSSYPTLPQFVNPHQASLMDPTTASSPLYQQYIQRLQEEQLRHSGVLHHQGLLGPSSGYPPGYHPALGIPRQSYDRPSWL